MGNLRAVLSVALLSLAACGGGGSDKPDAPLIHVDAAIDAIPDSPPPPDAPSYDFSCLNNTPPTNIATTVAVSGTAQEVVIVNMAPSIQPNGGVAIKACKGNCAGPNDLGTTTSTQGTGAYSTAALTTGGTALDGYLDATKTGDRRTLVYPPSPLAQSQSNVPVLQFNNGAFAALNSFINQTDTKGLVAIVVTDCMNMPIMGATVSAKQNGTAVGDAPFDLGAVAAQAAGSYLIANVPVGATEVGATYMGKTLRAHTVLSVAQATTTTGVRPGF